MTDRAGRWLIGWDRLTSFRNVDRDIWVARSIDNGASWMSARPLNAYARTDSGLDRRFCAATDGSGKWVVVWASTDSIGGTIGTDFDVLMEISTDHGATWRPRGD